MPDGTSGVSNVYFGTSNEDGVVRWEPLPVATLFDMVATDDAPYYERHIFDDAEPKEITFSLSWWCDPYAFIRDVLGFPALRKPKYTIRRLRRGGKSHRGKR